MLIVLTVIGALALVLGCFFFTLRHNALEGKRSYDLAFTAKLIAGVCFLLLGVLCAAWCKDKYWKFVTPIALAFGLAGDLLLSKSRTKGKLFFILGGLFFAVESYVLLMLMVSIKGTTFFFGLAFLLILGAATLFLAKKYGVRVGKLGVGLACYYVILLLMCGIAFGTMILSFTFGSLLFFLGAASFVVSDELLLLHNFGALREHRFGSLVMLTYAAGQVLFALALLAR